MKRPTVSVQNVGGSARGPGRAASSTLSPFDFLNRLADLVPPPRKHRHRYRGEFAPNHRLRKVVTAHAIGNVGKQHEAVSGENRIPVILGQTNFFLEFDVRFCRSQMFFEIALRSRLGS